MSKYKYGPRKPILSISLLAMLALAGCGGGGGSSGAAGPTTSDTSVGSPAPAPAVPTNGPVYYFSDCQIGAAAGCTPGNNANAGTSRSAPKQNLAGFNVNALPAGSQLLFARGGAWTGFNLQLRNLNVTSSNPMVFDAYGTGPAPWIKASGNYYAFQFGTFGDATVEGGYTVRNLKLDGQGIAGAWGFHLRNGTRDVVIENNEITGFDLGIHSQQNDGMEHTRLVVRNNNIHRNSGMGMLGDAVDMVIEGNTFAANNFSGSTFNHAIYLGGHGRNGVVRGNTFDRNSVVNGVCLGGNVTVHGQWNGLVIENNTMTQTASSGGCYGFSITPGYNDPEGFLNVVIRGNTVTNLGGCAICAGAAPGVLIESNTVINRQPDYQTAILLAANVGLSPGPGDAVDGGAVVRNNTICFSNPNPGSVAVGTARAGAVTVENNLYLTGAAASTGPCTP